MDISKNLENEINTNNQLIEKKQNSFLQSTLWNVINTSLNLGIRAVLPNFIEDEVIKIKDSIIDNGLKIGAKQAVTSAIDIGKTATGIITGNFENISQAQNAIKSGGLLDTISNLIDKAINSSVKKDLISKEVGNTLKKGKEIIINTIESNIENNFNTQQTNVEKISKHTENWEKYYESKDFKNMEKEYNKIKQTLKQTLPLENTLKKARQLENIHLLIKNKGEKFDLNKEELQLAEKLVT